MLRLLAPSRAVTGGIRDTPLTEVESDAPGTWMLGGSTGQDLLQTLTTGVKVCYARTRC
jgi:hypothetical protein